MVREQITKEDFWKYVSNYYGTKEILEIEKAFVTKLVNAKLRDTTVRVAAFLFVCARIRDEHEVHFHKDGMLALHLKHYSHEYLAEGCSMQRRTLLKALLELEEAGLIEVTYDKEDEE